MWPLKNSALLILALPLLVSSVRIQIDVPATHILANPATLPSDTKAVLSSNGSPLIAPISRHNNFVFADVPPGSHLLSVYSRDVTFENLRIDVEPSGEVASWQTYRGNEWTNTGEQRGGCEAADTQANIQVRAVAKREYYYDRPSFSATSILKSPMILIAIFSLAMVVGIPYIMDNMDPEMKAEFEAMQKSGTGATATTSNIQNMDLAGDFASWMAGKKTDTASGGDSKSDTQQRIKR
ncbi:hypothetical protein BT63DRAFT_186870 [Microthyrium microscopicum]|uniref:ER membrane protein complex subunit 7 beta-sandwich domain-containing protein n=1 Tax=Microthyrium microscopicum TaxID=703497 RepID=A0A6A6UIN4_9PEZI|nr:hypothetical protein BT63DRAFT_186870 [Microthyrium microscopicum]